MVKVRISKPVWVAEAEWRAMDDAQKKSALASGPKRKPGSTPSGGAPTVEVSSSPSAVTPLKDIRDWAEEVDGVSGERLRNCIIFQLDVKKDAWYRNRLTPAYVRVRAKKLDDDTPLGWTPNPLIRIETINLGGGETVERRVITRRPRDYDEWETVRAMLIDSRGKTNMDVAKFLVVPGCPVCGGEGKYKEKVHPDIKRLRWQEIYRSPCGCCLINPFKPKA
jgi:hypothetical protein